MASLKEKVLEIVEIAKICPENLQQICFEMLLKNELGLLRSSSPAPKPPADSADASTDGEAATTNGSNDELNQEDLTERELHAKARDFMKRKSVTLEHINNLFYKDNGSIKSLYDDLKTTKMSEGQIRIAMLQALRNGLITGDFSTTVEAVRSEATDRKYYDPPNFTKNFKKNGAVFDFGEWSAAVQTLRLSDEGKTQLASAIKELQ